MVLERISARRLPARSKAQWAAGVALISLVGMTLITFVAIMLDPSEPSVAPLAPASGELESEHSATVAGNMCRALVQDSAFHARIMSIPILPEEFCGCVAQRAYVLDGGASAGPYGTYHEMSVATYRIMLMESSQYCLQGR
jgi:hypothetical protein